MKNSFGQVVKAALIGTGVLFVSMIVSFFALSGGVSINTQAWPAGAKSILKESPGTPITSDQWKRIDKELSADPNNPKSSHLLAAEVRKTWFVFVALSVLALLPAYRLWRPLPIGAATALVAPTAMALLLRFP
jgi:hypothetical protein